MTTWDEFVKEHTEMYPEDRDILEWLEKPLEELIKTWNEEAYQEYRRDRRKKRREMRRK